MITFGFTPTQDDYIRSYRTFYLVNWLVWVSIVLTLLFLALVSFIFAIQENARLDDALINADGLLALGLLIGAAVFVFSRFVGNPLKAWHQVEANERLRCPVEYEVNEEQILIRTKFTETKTDWGTFTTFIETPDLLLLIYATNKNMFQIIPKRAFVSVSDIEVFKQLLLKKNMKQRVLGMPKQSRNEV